MSLLQLFTVWRLAFGPRPLIGANVGLFVDPEVYGPRPFSLHRPEALRKAVAKDCTLIYKHQDWVGT